MKFSSSNLSLNFTSIMGAQFNSPLNNFILLRNKLNYKSAVILHEGKQSLSKANLCHFFHKTIPEFDTILL